MPRLNGTAPEVFRAVITIITEDTNGNEVSRATQYAGPFVAKAHAKAAITSIQNWAEEWGRYYMHGDRTVKRIEAHRERAPLNWSHLE